MMTLDEVRVNIDRVDKEIKKLFIERMALAEQVAQIKAQSADSIYKPDREAIIIEKQSKDVEPHLSAEYKALIKRIMEVSRKYQYGRTLEMRNCFPYELETEEVKPERIAMLKSELYICDGYSKDEVRTENSYEEIAKLFENDEIDAAMGIIENIGCGVSDELNTLLLRHNLYINRCIVKNENGDKKKLVELSRHLVVREDHNRLKLVFVCPNKSGAIGSILSMIADYGVNLTEIHSIPYLDGEDWNYRFFLEMNLNLLQKEAKALIFQLSQETLYMQLLGSYRCEGDFVR